MPRNPEDYGNRYNDGENAIYEDCSREWTVTGERFRHAGEHLVMFDMAVNSGIPDMIGFHGHRALEHAMKALISAHGRQYKTTRNLDRLAVDVRRADPELRFSLEISGGIYNQYARLAGYGPAGTPRKSHLSRIPGYDEKTRANVRQLLDRAREVQDRQ